MVATKTKGKMTAAQVRDKAVALGIKSGKMKKNELIHAIQRAEGCTACYGTSNGDCPQFECCFRTDCFTTKN